jgi:hypothetical protein
MLLRYREMVHRPCTSQGYKRREWEDGRKSIEKGRYRAEKAR